MARRRRTARRSKSGNSGRQQFKRALGWAEAQQLIGIDEIDDVIYLRLSRPDREEDEQC